MNVAVGQPGPGSERLPPVDVIVIGGGPAGLSAALWSARHRRRVLLVDGGRPRNAPVVATHGYLASDGVDPQELLLRARRDLVNYPEASVVTGVEAGHVVVRADGFDVVLDDGRVVRALRLILATGVVDLLPDIDHFADYYGSNVYTCPACDGYEAKDKAVAVIGDDDHLSAFAIGMLDWAATVTMIIEPDSARTHAEELQHVRSAGVDIVIGSPAALTGTAGTLEAVCLSDGSVVPCDVLFCTVGHVQHSDVAERLGCEMTDDGCVMVDEDCRTSVSHVFAAGDMTPGPHLVQVAAAEGARAGVAAALSLRGEPGVPGSPRPAPDPDNVPGRR